MENTNPLPPIFTPNDLKANYLKQWVEKKASDADNTENNQVAFNTLSRFFEHILHRKFEGDFLDLGCGDGSFYRYCQSQGLPSTGIDLSDGVNFEHDKLPYVNAGFDIVLMYSVLEHILDPSNILNEVKRVLRPGGVVVFITPNINASVKEFYNDPTHIKPYNPTGIAWLMKSFGFQKAFIGLWIARKPAYIWKFPANIQFWIGKMLPFRGRTKGVPSFLKGKSYTMLCVFSVLP